MKDKFYITSAIAYASGKPHIGNMYEIILADALARYKRNLGYDVFYQTGTDEHGEKIANKAKECNLTPKEFVDEKTSVIKELWDLMDIKYDNFIRTTDSYHKEQVQKVFKKMVDKGDIYKGYYTGLYCTPCESFWTESQLVDGMCPDCGRPVQEAKEEAYFFKMSKYAPRLIKYIEDNPDFIRPVSRKNEMVNNFLKPGLQDLCVTRTSFDWGVKIKEDPRHVVYVWLDALLNYVTGLGYDVNGNHDELFNKYWPASLHLVGKDIIRFHTLYWPIFLMSLDLELPKQIFGHPWLLQNNDKMSKSKGNLLYPDDLANTYGVDAIRYFVLHETPFDNDGNITHELIIERFNSDLANILGNLVNRSISMANKYFNGVIVKKVSDDEYSNDLINLVKSSKVKVDKAIDEIRVGDAISYIFDIFKRCNKYIDETCPWILAKDEANKEKLEAVIYNLAESIIIGASLLEPFMPSTSEKILSFFNQSIRDYSKLDEFGLLLDNTKIIEKPEILFTRIDVKK